MAVQNRRWQTSLDGIENLRLVTTTVDSPTHKQILVRVTAMSLNYKDGETINGLFKQHKTSVATPDLVPCSGDGRVSIMGLLIGKAAGAKVIVTSEALDMMWEGSHFWEIVVKVAD